FLSSADNCHVFPLYSYESNNGRRANLAPAFLTALAERTAMMALTEGQGDLHTTFGPEDVLHYVYAIFHSREYRQRYAEHLTDGFPRLPLPGGAGVFRCLCARGSGLARQHLFEDSGRGRKSTATLRGKGIREVATGYPRYEDGRVWINASRWFDGVTPDAWNCSIGAHQVCAKWLKDRRGRCLTN